MNAVFFEELAIPEPDINLEVGSGTNSEQTARIMLGLETAFVENRPDMLVVVGDVNSTMAAALVAAKLLIPIAHVEAGMRSNDRTMPEEINRLVTDRLSDLLLTTERAAAKNLIREGVKSEQIRFVGNVMIDTLHACLDRARPAHATIREHGAHDDFVAAARERFGFVTLHRPANVDDPDILRGVLEALVDISQSIPLVFAMHPRTKAKIASGNLADILSEGRILVTPPLSYLQALGLMREAHLAITDSGGVQEETTALGVPCLTVRDNTERPITITEGTNVLVGRSPEALRRAARAALAMASKRGRIPELWDGKAAERVVGHVQAYLRQLTPESSPVGVTAHGAASEAGRGWLSGLAARTAARIRGFGLGQGLSQDLRQGFSRTILNAAFLALSVVVTLLALYPDLHLYVLQGLKDATEPLGHTVAFFALTVLGTITWGLTWPLIAGLSGLAAWLELAQFLSPGREPDLSQVAGGLAGILFGLILARLWRLDRRAI